MGIETTPARFYVLQSPDGQTVEVYNLRHWVYTSGYFAGSEQSAYCQLVRLKQTLRGAAKTPTYTYHGWRMLSYQDQPDSSLRPAEKTGICPQCGQTFTYTHTRTYCPDCSAQRQKTAHDAGSKIYYEKHKEEQCKRVTENWRKRKARMTPEEWAAYREKANAQALKYYHQRKHGLSSSDEPPARVCRVCGKPLPKGKHTLCSPECRKLSAPKNRKEEMKMKKMKAAHTLYVAKQSIWGACFSCRYYYFETIKERNAFVRNTDYTDIAGTVKLNDRQYQQWKECGTWDEYDIYDD